MTKTMTNKWLQIAFCSLIFASCQKSVDGVPANGIGEQGTNTLSSARIAADDCLTSSDVVNGTGTGYAYANFTPVTKVLGTGPTIQFEGNFSSFVRPVTASWYIGTLEEDYACSSWDDIKTLISVKNASGNVGSLPASPYNVVGYDNVNYGLGYYGYVGQVATPTKLIVVWEDGNSTAASYVSNPANATAAYVIRVNSITPGGTPPSLTSTVPYDYYKVL